MPTQHPKRQIFASIEDSSILRKFTILFVVMSLLPTGVLWYLYLHLRERGFIQIGESEFNLALTFVVLGVIVGYVTMRSIINQLVDLAASSQEALQKISRHSNVQQLSVEKNEIAVLAQSFADITQRLEENVRSLEIARKTLHSVMSKVGQGIANMQNIDTFLDLIIETVTEGLAGKTGYILLFKEGANTLAVRSSYGEGREQAAGAEIEVSAENPIFEAVTLKRPLMLKDGDVDVKVNGRKRKLFTLPIVCAPLAIRGKVKGLIVVSEKGKDKDFDDEDLNLLHNLATQTAIAVENSRLNQDIEKTYLETISALALAVDARDKYSRGHLDRVAKYCLQIADRLGLSDEDIHLLRDGARLHDLGKIGIPDEILKKADPLTDQERVLMNKHPEIGESIIKPITSLQPVCDLIRHHHEKLDGSGYPDGLTGDAISPLVRILTVADIYDALTTGRSYREKFSQFKAFEMLRDMKGQLDPDIVEIFIETLQAEN